MASIGAARATARGAVVRRRALVLVVVVVVVVVVVMAVVVVVVKVVEATTCTGKGIRSWPSAGTEAASSSWRRKDGGADVERRRI